MKKTTGAGSGERGSLVVADGGLALGGDRRALTALEFQGLLAVPAVPAEARASLRRMVVPLKLRPSKSFRQAWATGRRERYSTRRRRRQRRAGCCTCGCTGKGGKVRYLPLHPEGETAAALFRRVLA